jgi:mannose-6-phosphate isomerase-like protein (cupin superfamily)
MSDYTIVRCAQAPDFSGDAPGAFLGYGRALASEQVSINIRALAPQQSNCPPGFDPAWGHSHRTIEEIYLVLDGELKVKLGERVETLHRYDAVRIPPQTPRAARNDTDGDVLFAMISRRLQDMREETIDHEGFWPAV